MEKPKRIIELERLLKINLFDYKVNASIFENVNTFQLDNNGNVIGLNLNNNNIFEISFLVNFPKLDWLMLNQNQISDISVIQNLTSLTKLELSQNQISNIWYLENLHSIRTLDISNNNITDFSVLENHMGLQNLSLRGLKISDVSFLSGLTNLRSLHLDNNELFDISPIQNLINLDMLTLDNNNISDLSATKEMNQLSFLVCYSNLVSDLISLKDSKVRFLHLGYNQIEDISVISTMRNLVSLNMQGNFISDIAPLMKCRRLENLVLQNNNIKNIDGLDIKFLNRLVAIDLKDNPIQNTTISDFSDLEAIKGFVQNFNKENALVYNRYVKINIIGSGRIGKTQLFKWLLKEKYNPQELETHGTGVAVYQIPNKKHKASLWDFGGQSYQHGTHSLFLRPTDFYIVLHRSVKDEHGYSYWIGAARNFAPGKLNENYLAPLMVVQSIWSKEKDKLIYIDSKKFNHYELSANSIFHVDIHEFQKNSEIWDSKKKYFTDSLNAQIVNHAHSFGKIPRKFLAIRDKMEKSPFDIYMKKDDFKKVFASKYSTSDFAYLLQYLEFTGSIIYFREKTLLENYIFTNPKDLSDWIYNTVLNKIFQKDNMGVLSFQQLVKDFGDDKSRIFKELMLEFNLLFVEPKLGLEESDSLVVPQYLPANNSSLKKFLLELIPFTFCIRFEDFIYEGRIFNFISKFGKYAEDKTAYWKYGILFKYNEIRTIVYYDIVRRTVYVHLENKKDNIYLARYILDFFILRQRNGEYADENTVGNFIDHHNISLEELNIMSNRYFNYELTEESIVPKEIENLFSVSSQRHYRSLSYKRKKNPYRFQLYHHNYFSEKRVEEPRVLHGDNIIIGAHLSTNNENYIDIIETLTNANDSLNVGYCVIHKKSIKLDYLTIKLLGMEERKLPKVFISYSRKDLEYKDKLRSHLSVLERYDLVKAWSCDQMNAGKWHKQIQQELEDADIIIYMVSHNFMSSDYIMDEEVKKGIKMAEEDPNKKIICVVVGACQWQNWTSLESKYKEKNPSADFLSSDLSQFQFLPYHQYKNEQGVGIREEIVALEKWGRYPYDVENEAYNQIVGRVMKEVK